MELTEVPDSARLTICWPCVPLPKVLASPQIVPSVLSSFLCACMCLGLTYISPRLTPAFATMSDAEQALFVRVVQFGLCSSLKQMWNVTGYSQVYCISAYQTNVTVETSQFPFNIVPSSQACRHASCLASMNLTLMSSSTVGLLVLVCKERHYITSFFFLTFSSIPLVFS